LKARIKFGEQYKSLNSSLCCLYHWFVTSSLLRPNIFLSTLYSNTLNPRSSLNVRDVQCSNSIEIWGETTL
jgi:hypothetical protein